MALLQSLGIITAEEALTMTEEEAGFLANQVNFSLLQLALTNDEVRNQVRDQVAEPVDVVRRRIGGRGAAPSNG